ncbi:MAG: hypothetical protein NTW49_04655 [Bacteroidia bacterium]|nr:hypothetical protein [Bacteroidia bacterium]
MFRIALIETLLSAGTSVKYRNMNISFHNSSIFYSGFDKLSHRCHRELSHRIHIGR